MVETFFDLHELEHRDRRGPLGLVAADRRADDLRRATARRSRASPPSRRRSGSARSAWPRSAPTTAPARPRRCWRWPGWTATARRSPRSRTSGSRACPASAIVFPHATPEYFAEFAAQARGLGARLIGGCCGTTPAQIAAIRAAVDEGRAPVGLPARRASESRRRPSSPARQETRLARMLARGRVRRLGAGRSAARREPGGADRHRARRPQSRQRAVRRRQRQPAGAGADERDHGVRRDRALHRSRDDPAPDAARHDDHRARVAAARRPRGGRPQHPRGHRRPARGGRLPRDARRLRGRLDRARRADREAERRRGLARPRRSTRRPPSSRASPSTRPRTTSASRRSASTARSRPAPASR